MNTFRTYYSSKGIACMECYKNMNNNQKLQYVCHDDVMDPIQLYTNLSKLSCGVCSTSLREIYNNINNFRIFSSKENDIDYCKDCYDRFNPSGNFKEIVWPDDRSTSEKIYNSWNEIFNYLQCDGCYRRFYDIFVKPTDLEYSNNISPTIHSTRMCHQSAGRSNRNLNNGLDNTFMCNQSSGRSNRNLNNGLDNTFMCNQSSGRSNRYSVTKMKHESSGAVIKNLD